MHNFLQHKSARLIALVALLPLLIGHGLGLPSDDADPVPVWGTISGGSDRIADLNIGDSLHISTTLFEYTSSDSDKNLAVPALNFTSYIDADWVFRANSISATSIIGESWIHAPVGDGSLKLLHAALSPSYIDGIFNVSTPRFSEAQSSTIASSGQYSISGDSTGSDSLTVTTPMTIYHNGTEIYSRIDGDSIYPAPIMFDAIIGDTLRVVLGENGEQNQRAYPTWLHTPDGDGIKLFHTIEKGTPDTDTSPFFDVTYGL